MKVSKSFFSDNNPFFPNTYGIAERVRVTRVCVWKREWVRERGREREKKSAKERERECGCVCEWVRLLERERENNMKCEQLGERKQKYEGLNGSQLCVC